MTAPNSCNDLHSVSCGDLNCVCLFAQDDVPDEGLAEALERLFSYRLKARPFSDLLRDRLSAKPYHSLLKAPPTEYLCQKIESLHDWVWHHIDGAERHRKRLGSLPTIAEIKSKRFSTLPEIEFPRFKKSQLLGMKNVVADWVQRNPIDFALLSDAIKVENALRRIVENPTSQDSRVNELLNMLIEDERFELSGLGTKEGERAKGYRKLRAAKQKQNPKYMEAVRLHEASKQKG